MEEKTHWKKLRNNDYIGAYTLQDGQTKDLVVSIRSVSKQEVKGEDGKKDMCSVAQLYDQKPLILNATNSKMLAKLFKSPYVEDWCGKPFTLYVANIKIGGEFTDCLRIRPTLPVTPAAPVLPELTPSHDKWVGAKESIQTGKCELSDILKHYKISEANQKLLIAA